MPLLAALDRWKPRHLLAAWSAYWAGLAAVTLGPAFVQIWRVTQGADNTGSVSAGITNGIAKLEIIERGATIWTGSAELSTILALVALPPLALWAVWVVRRPRRAQHADVAGSPDRPAIGAGPWDAPAPRRGEADAVERDERGRGGRATRPHE